jgi:RNA polymerase sigma-54 factor
MELKQQLRLTQQLVMTPQLQQAIRLLQLSRLELIDEVRKELDGNPILTSEDEPDPKGRTAEDVPRSGELPINGGARTLESAEADGGYSLGEHKVEAEKATREVDWEKFLENRSQQQAPSLGPRNSDDLPPFEQNLTKPNSLAEHLRWQLQMSDFTDLERRFAELVIGNLDERGYLDLEGVDRPDGTRTPDLTIEDLAEEAGLHPDDAPLVLEMIQNFDPVGVAARSLQECLLVQAKAFGFDAIEIAILEKHMANLEKHNYQAIARDMKISLEETYEAAKEIQKLESRPARNFVDHSDRSIGITPDVYVIKDGDNFVVADNDRGVQKLHINQALAERSGCAGVRRRKATQCAMADPGHRAAPQDDRQGVGVDHRQAARVFREGGRLSQADDPAGRGRGGRNARVDDLARDDE